MPNLGPAGRGGARRRTRRRTTRRVSAASSAASQPASQSQQSESDPMDELKKLGELRDSGVITDQEFESKKAELLKEI